MKAVTCPKCRAQAVAAEAKPYCPKCGWNREIAERHLRQQLRSYRNALVVIPIVIYLGARWWLGFPWSAFFVATGFLGSIALLSYLTVRHELKKIQALPAAVEPEIEPARSPAEPEAQARADDLDSPLLRVTGSTVPYRGREIPVAWPRRVRLARKTLGIYAVLYASLLYLEGVLLYKIYQEKEKLTQGEGLPWGLLFLVLLAAFVLFAAWAFPRKLRKQRRLLTTGDLALARITAQRVRRSGDSRDSLIRYEFTDATGRRVSGEDTDQTESFYEGMVLPVFYDRGNSDNHVVLCSTDYQVLPLSRDS